MIHKTHSPRVAHTRVTFEVPATLWAARIVVEGPQTAPISTALVQAHDGTWRTQLDLPSDQHYHFHYHADGFATTPQGAYRSLLATGRGRH